MARQAVLAKNVRMIPANPMLTPTGRTKNRKERVCAYCRVSTDEEDQLNSYAAQMEYYEKKISETPGWSNAGVYADEGISGTSMDKRASFNRMIRACRQGKIDRILCKSVSRFARNTVDCLDTIRELRTRGITVYFEKENIDTLTITSEFIITLYSSFAQAESESISANVRIGKRYCMEQGKVTMRTDVLLGYTKDKDGKPIIEPNGAKTVMRIYTDYLAGKSLVQIQRELSEESVPTALGVKEWSRSAVQNILTNEKYMGDALLQKWYKESCLTRNCKKNNGELPQYYVENNHEGIISKEVFGRVQEEMARRANKRKATTQIGERTKGKYSALYALTEKLVCGECGTPYRRCTWTASGKKRIVWRCIARLEHAKKYCKKSPTLDEYNIHEAVVIAVNRLCEGKDEIRELVEYAVRTTYGTKEGEADIPAMRQRLKDISIVFDNLMDRAFDGEDSSETLDKKIRAITDEQEALESAIKEYELQKAAEENGSERLKEIFAAIDKTPCALTEYDDMLTRQIVDVITVNDKHRLTVGFGLGINIEVEIPE